MTSSSHHQPRHEDKSPRDFSRQEKQAQLHDVKTFLEWEAPGRPFVERSREYFINILLITTALEIIIFLFSRLPQDLPLLMLVPALAFLAIVIAIVPPRNFHYKITSEGIRVEDYFYIWEELYDFFFIKHHGKDVLYLTTKDYYPGELKVTLGDIPAEEVKKAILPYLPYREYVKPTFMEKSGEWLAKNFPLEK